MKKVFNLLIAIFGAILLAALISNFISLSVWLDMRVHSRHIYYLCIALAIIASLFGKVNEKTFLIVELLSVLSILLLDKFMRTIYEIREALYIDINIELFKNIFMIALILINIMVFLKIVKMKKKSA